MPHRGAEKRRSRPTGNPPHSHSTYSALRKHTQPRTRAQRSALSA